jgi:S1-C subfamily serine protease
MRGTRGFPVPIVTAIAVLLSCVSNGAAQTSRLSSAVAVYEKVSPSLAFIQARSAKGVAIGTGFCIGSHDGVAYVLTSKHVVGNDPRPEVMLWADKTSLLYGSVVRTSTLDAVVLSIRDATCPPLTLSKEPPAVGTAIAIAGFPSMQIALAKIGDLSPSFHEGSVSAIAAGGGLLQYDAQTDYGNSGSPLFDARTGEVYGVVTWASTGQTGALQNNLAISIGALAPFLDNSHANVAYEAEEAAPSPGASAVAVAQPLNVIDSKCGSGASAGLVQSMKKAEAELNANDYPSASTDARTVIEGANFCATSFAVTCQPGEVCNDASYVLLGALQLSGQQVLRIATARMGGDTVNAVRNEMDTALLLCKSPNITDALQPYAAARGFIAASIDLARKTYRAPMYRGVLDVREIRGCASKIGVRF